MKQSGKKSLICILFGLVLCVASAFALTACKKDPEVKKYTVVFMDGDTQIGEQTVEQNKTAELPANPEKAATNDTVYTFAGWSLTVDGEIVTDFVIKANTTFYAVYTSAVRTYEIKFVNGDSQVGETQVLAYNATAAAPTVTKEATAQYTYTFDGWYTQAEGGEKVTDFTVKANATYYARFTATVNKYDVKFMNDGAQIGDTQNIEYGATAAAPTVTKEATAQYTYTFDGWYTEAEGGEKVTDFTVKANATYYARFTATVNKYDVIFMNGETQVGDTQNLDYGATATVPTVTKEATAQYTYTFDGWYTQAEGGEKVTDFTVKANATYYARFTATVNKYDVKFMNGETQVGDTQNLDYGATATAPTVTKEATAQYTYTFDGWYTQAEGGEKVTDFTVKANATYYARFNQIVNKYTVKFVNQKGGSVAQDVEVAYGDSLEFPTIEKVVDGQWFYGWMKADERVTELTVTEDITLVAVYKDYGTVVDETFYQRGKDQYTIESSDEEIPLGYKSVYKISTTAEYIHGQCYSGIILTNYSEVRFAIKTDCNFVLNGTGSNASHNWLYFLLVQNENGTWKTTVTDSNGAVVYKPSDLGAFKSETPSPYTNYALNAILFGIPSGFYPSKPGDIETMNILFTEVRGTVKENVVNGVEVDKNVYNVNKLTMTTVTDYAVYGYNTVMTYSTADNSIHGMNYSAVDLRNYSEINFAIRSSYGINFNNAASDYSVDWVYVTMNQNADTTWNFTAKKADGTVITTITSLLANKDGLGSAYTAYALNAILYGLPSKGIYPLKSDTVATLTVWTTEIRGTLAEA